MAQMKAWAPWQRQKSSRSSCRWTTTRLTAETPTAWHSSCAGGWRALAQFVRTLGSRLGRRHACLRPQVEQRVERGGRRRARHARVVGRRVDDLAVLADVGRQDGHCAGRRQARGRELFLPQSSQFSAKVVMRPTRKRVASTGSQRCTTSALCAVRVRRPEALAQARSLLRPLCQPNQQPHPALDAPRRLPARRAALLRRRRHL